MSAFLDKLPTILILAVLVGIFLSLRKHAPSVRVRLWTYAWALIFLHFLVQVFETHTGTPELIFESIDLASLELSGIVFVVSMMFSIENRANRTGLLVMLGVPTLFQAVAVTFNWNIPATLSVVLGIIFFGGALFPLFASRRSRIFNIGLALILAGTGVWAIHDQLHGNSDFAVNAILTLGFGLCGVLCWRRYARWSPGVIAVSGGFLCWGAVFPVATLLAEYLPKLQLNGELWNVPKYFVAFGMVLTLLEDKSTIIEATSERERAENRLLERLARVTSRLLAGKDPAVLCDEIAAALTEASSFGQAALLLAAEDHSVRIAGSSRFSEVDLAELREQTGGWTIEKFKALYQEGNRLGNNSFWVPAVGGMVLMPLISWRGSHVGCICLRKSKKAAPIEASEFVKLEVLASDLAVTIENSRLHHQLVRSEKLAALGQLVAGVAHELNNPLTGIIGYSDLLADELKQDTAAKRVAKLGHEARRMKRIVDGLLRFARQNNPAMRAADLEAALRDVIQLREYHIRKHNIQMSVHVDPAMPRIAIGEDELKQVLLNILNNAIDAVEESAKREIRIAVTSQDNRAVIQFEDSGPGFTDPNRAFDPFYTTKPVGKGTGLGLSICYGIVQECGGEITLANKQPYGASVALELPIAAAAVAHSIAALPTSLNI